MIWIGGEKRKKSDDEEDIDDRLEDEDYDLLEENLGVKVERRVSIFTCVYIFNWPNILKLFGKSSTLHKSYYFPHIIHKNQFVKIL